MSARKPADVPMPYAVDRQRALRAGDVVAILSSRQHRVRSRVVLRDNSLYRTLTRPATLVKAFELSSGFWASRANRA